MAVNAIDDQGIVGTVLQQLPTEPNAHAIGADPGNRFVFSTSLGGERLQRFDFDARSGRLTPHATPGVLIEPPAGGRAGPRHFVFHPNGRWLYVLHELDASVAVFAFDGANGGTTALQRIGTLPSGFDGAPWAAEIRIAADGRHLYTSERRSSTLATLAIDARTGTLTLAGHQATETQPRGFALDPTGRWLLCAGQVSGASAATRCMPPAVRSVPRPRPSKSGPIRTGSRRWRWRWPESDMARPNIFLSFNRNALAHYYGDKALAGLRALGEVRLNDSDSALDGDTLTEAAGVAR